MLTVTSDWITRAECAAVLAEIDACPEDRLLRKDTLRIEVPVYNLGPSARALCTRMLEVQRRLYRPDLVEEFGLVTAMHPGDRHGYHADNVKCVADEWVPNHAAQRTSPRWCT